MVWLCFLLYIKLTALSALTQGPLTSLIYKNNISTCQKVCIHHPWPLFPCTFSQLNVWSFAHPMAMQLHSWSWAGTVAVLGSVRTLAAPCSGIAMAVPDTMSPFCLWEGWWLPDPSRTMEDHSEPGAINAHGDNPNLPVTLGLLLTLSSCRTVLKSLLLLLNTMSPHIHSLWTGAL